MPKEGLELATVHCVLCAALALQRRMRGLGDQRRTRSAGRRRSRGRWMSAPSSTLETHIVIRARHDSVVRFSYTIAERKSDSPRWVRALAGQLEHEGAQAPPEILGPVSALRELSTAAAAVLQGRIARSSEDRRSLRDDLRLSLDSLGDELRSEIASALAPVRQDLRRLPQLLGEPKGALQVKGRCDAAFWALRDAAVCEAAWRDAQAAFESQAFAGTCELRIKQLSELVKMRGGDWKSTARVARGVLNDDPISLHEVGAFDISDNDDVAALANEPAGTALDERLALPWRQWLLILQWAKSSAGSVSRTHSSGACTWSSVSWSSSGISCGRRPLPTATPPPGTRVLSSRIGGMSSTSMSFPRSRSFSPEFP
jgi:hypothetical protein